MTPIFLVIYILLSSSMMNILHPSGLCSAGVSITVRKVYGAGMNMIPVRRECRTGVNMITVRQECRTGVNMITPNKTQRGDKNYFF